MLCLLYVRDDGRHVRGWTSNCFVMDMLYSCFILCRNTGFSLHQMGCNFSSSLQRKMFGASELWSHCLLATSITLAGSDPLCCMRGFLPWLRWRTNYTTFSACNETAIRPILEEEFVSKYWFRNKSDSMGSTFCICLYFLIFLFLILLPLRSQ
jgi:hypothetical protein